MKPTPLRILSGGTLALTLTIALMAGAVAASSDTTEPTGNSGAPGGTAPGCAEIVTLLSAQYGVATAYLGEDGAALGALFAVYKDANKNCEELARLGVQAGIEFDDGSGLPITSYTIKLDD